MGPKQYLSENAPFLLLPAMETCILADSDLENLTCMEASDTFRTFATTSLQHSLSVAAVFE